MTFNLLFLIYDFSSVLSLCLAISCIICVLTVVIVLFVVKSRCHNKLVDTHWLASERSGSCLDG